jgi:hypothetical protein
MEMTTEAKYMIAGLVLWTVIGIFLTKYQFKEFIKDQDSHDALAAAIVFWPLFLIFKLGDWIKK